MKMKAVVLGICGFMALAVPAAGKEAWSDVARRVAEDGTVLLKNENAVLPLAPGAKVALYGAKKLLKCGGGSSKVHTPYETSLEDGLKAAGLAVVPPCDASAGIVLVTRFSKEGEDCPPETFELTREEIAAVEEAKRVCGKAVALVNTGHLVDLQPLKERADAILFAWFTGQEGGRALGRIIAGAVNPSGRLADTIAAKLSDWPADADFHASEDVLKYSEAAVPIYLHFAENAPERIVYPFGWGLSYTTFSESAPAIDAAAGTVAVTVANTGSRSGRHSVLWFEGGELAAYAKTRLLGPGERERLVMKPWRGAPPLEPSPRDGEIEELLAKLTLEEKLNLCSAQPSAALRGTAGIGNLPQYGIPNAQTADGPNGVRRAVACTGYPAGSHLAQSFDDALAEEMGRAIGEEAKSLKVDILLGPGLNIHRHPLCGRNFEYFSEDPLLSGKMAAAYVRGVQSTGTAATLKHFACNSREWNRHEYSAEIGEEALRRIYLKGFEIAVKEGRPRCVMTAYNKLDGVPCGESAKLVDGILRGEWGFDGLVMTDWRAHSAIWKQVAAGTDVYMPFGYPEKVERAIEKAKSGELPMQAVDAAARRILAEAKKSHRFRERDFGAVSRIKAEGETIVPAKDFYAVSSTWTWYCDDPVEGWGHAALKKDPGGNDTFVQFVVDVEKAGDYEVSIRARSSIGSSECAFEVDGRTTERFAVPKSKEWRDFGPVRLTLREGRTKINVWFYSGTEEWVWSKKGASFTRLAFIPRQ